MYRFMTTGVVTSSLYFERRSIVIKIEHTDIVGWESAVRGMRNPLNSLAKSDSSFVCTDYDSTSERDIYEYEIGPNDKDLMKRLCKAGTDHRKFMRMITVYLDITAPLYWWKEFDTYKIGTVANSCSTMHKIHAKEFTLEDFSYEHILDETFTGEVIPMVLLEATIKCLNENRAHYLSTKDKKYWWQMIQLLPSSYNQKRTVMLNYEALCNMYSARKNHKLDCWCEFCKWIETLPYSELITGEFEE